jgi:acetyl-CoA carboxylase biotin carboxylase subunit
VHFGTRDCSTQRRHQKLIEEAPAPFLDCDTRKKIHAAAVAAARSVGYYNAGTAEFLVKGSEFYFLEINTRIQVEHPVTEAITGVDLVQLQLRVAMGESLPFSQSVIDVNFNGHAIEFRINAEDVSAGFRPAIGEISKWSRPAVDGVTLREDSGYREGDAIPPFYDSLISKVIVTGRDRSEAIFRGYNFLKRYAINGVPTTIPFHIWLLANGDFQGDGIDIGYVERVLGPDTVEDELAHALELAKIDEAHRNPFEGSATGFGEELVEFLSLAELAPYALPVGAVRLELRHELGGTFLGVPLANDNSPLGCELWRRSNTRRGVLSAWGLSG